MRADIRLGSLVELARGVAAYFDARAARLRLPHRPDPRARGRGGGPMSALSGVRVLDLTNVLSGPFCTLHLALLGADVVKIENPKAGDLARVLGNVPKFNKLLMGTSFLAQNANKKSLTLNLKAPEGKEIFRKLVKTADVVVENFRPDVMTRLGLGYPVLAEINPRLVYCGISGFGQTGPDAEKPAYDQIIQGLSGAMDVNGDERLHPLRAGFPVCDTVGGLNAAFAILAALYHRERTGEGQMIDVALLDSIMPLMGWVAANLLIGGQPPLPMGNDNFTAAPSGIVPHAGRPRQHRRQQAGAVGGAGRGDRRAGAEGGPALQGARRAQAEPQGAHAARRGEAGAEADRALGRGAERARRAVGRHPVARRGADAAAGAPPRGAARRPRRAARSAT